jgi:DNA-binding LacI/PurR family transcriptional regulator
VDVRLGGYQEALHAHQGSDAQPLVKWVDPSDVTAVREFLDRAKPEAIVCANDYTAAQLLTTLNTIGVPVPGQIRVAGIDDVKYARLLQTPLTTIRQPCLEIGATALLAMLDRIAHPAAPSREFLVDFQLIIRKSTEPDAPVWPESETTNRSAGEETPPARAAKADETPSSTPTGLGMARTDKL